LTLWSEPDLTDIYLKYVRRVRGYLYRLTGSPDAAEELDGATSGKTSSLVEEHLRECARCRATLERYRDARRALRASLSDVPQEEAGELARDARTLARAQRRLRRRAAAALGLTVVGALVLWAAAWLATTPAAPGLYLGRLRASQIVLTGSPSDGMALPVLWVPAYPGQQPPEMRTVVISLVRGTPTLELNVAGVVWDKGWFGLPRYRKGTIHAHCGAGYFVSEGPASYFQPYGRTSDTDLTVVQTYGQSGRGYLTVGFGGSPEQLQLHLTAARALSWQARELPGSKDSRLSSRAP